MKQALKLTNLNKIYSNGVVALDSVNLIVEEGDFFALLGPNGAGKSTLIGIVSDLVNKTSGQVAIFGHDVDQQKYEAKSSLGLVPQEFNFSQFETPYQILVNQAGYYGIPRKVAGQRADKLLEQLSLGDKRNQTSRQLSGGMKRRLMIARALMHQPRLLILDEPTAGVDIELRRSMWDFLVELNQQGTSILLTTHYLEEAETLCRTIAIINEGRIVEKQSKKALLSKLDTETYILDIASSAKSIQEHEKYTIRQIDATTLEVDVRREDSINPIFNWLDHQGIKVLSMRNKTNRLEELFIQLIEQPQPSPNQ